MDVLSRSNVQVHGRRDRPQQALADELTAAMLGGVEAKDDVCVVAARWNGPR
jgi:hypothetical protein